MKLDELHDKLFDLLCLIDDICKKENVKYYLDSGSELGAIRDHGFIPWDDDLDLKVLAEDYPAFKAAMEKNLPEHLHIVEPDIFSPLFYDFIVRVYDDRYLLRDETDKDRAYNNYQNHVGADIFIMSKAPASKTKRAFLRLRLKLIYGLAMSRRFDIDYSEYSGVQKLSVRLLAFFGKLFPIKKLFKLYFKKLHNWDDAQTDTRIKYNVPIKWLRDYPSDIFDGEDASAPIRSRQFPVPHNYEKEMLYAYGSDWRTPKRNGDFIRHLSEEDRAQDAN